MGCKFTYKGITYETKEDLLETLKNEINTPKITPPLTYGFSLEKFATPGLDTTINQNKANLANAFIGYGEEGRTASQYQKAAKSANLPTNNSINADSNTIAYIEVNSGVNLSSEDLQSYLSNIFDVLENGGTVILSDKRTSQNSLNRERKGRIHAHIAKYIKDRNLDIQSGEVASIAYYGKNPLEIIKEPQTITTPQIETTLKEQNAQKVVDKLKELYPETEITTDMLVPQNANINLKRGDKFEFQLENYEAQRVRDNGIDVINLKTGNYDFISTEDYLAEINNMNNVKEETIKEGVPELFESNPELANQVYEALGFKSKPDVILPIGTSGSGKSTFIKSLPQENLVVIEPDSMRVEFTGNMNDKSKDKEIYEEAAKRAIKAIKQGKQVVFDTTNLTKDKRLPFIEAIKKEIPNANIQYKLMELNPELAKQRIKAQLERGENRAAVSDSTIDRHAESYKQMLIDIQNEPISSYELTPQQKQQAQQLYSTFLDKFIQRNFNSLVSEMENKNLIEKKCN